MAELKENVNKKSEEKTEWQQAPFNTFKGKVKVKMPKIVQPVLLGFSLSINHANKGIISLQPIKQPIKKPILIKYIKNSKYIVNIIDDIWRDSNKLYMGIRGYPLNMVFKNVNFDDCGIMFSEMKHTKIISEYKSDKDELYFVGGMWIGTSNDYKMTNKTRILIGKRNFDVSNKWDIVVTTIKDINGLSIENIMKYAIKTYGDDMENSVILPIIQPIKHKTPKGFVYIG